MGGLPIYYIEVALLWLFSTLMLNSVMYGFHIHCNEKDINILLKFRQGVTDPTNILSSWFMEKDCCQWKGVRCDNITGRVTELNLPYSDEVEKSHYLTGELELSLLDLEFLRYLNLSNNNFRTIHYNPIGSQKCNVLSSGTPPLRCNNFSNLQVLDLSYNNYLSIDNLHWVSQLLSLQYLDLSGIALSQIDWVQSVTILPSLLELHLAGCRLDNIYPSLQYANFSVLQVLDIPHNDFVSNELPRWIFNFSSDISYIDLSQNHIHGNLPEILPNFRNIKSLKLSRTSIDGSIPDWLGQLEYLQVLNLSYNSLSGSIPTSLGNLSSLNALNLESNNLTGNLPESLGLLLNLEVLAVGHNFLTGVVSERNFFYLSNLKHLFLSSPTFTYNFDPKWIPPFELEGIQLGYMGVPSWLFTQSSLKKLTITDSIASFEPQDKFWNFAEVEQLCLENNQIDADLSSVLLNATVTWLSSNCIRGGLPQISQNVVVLDLSNNYFSGAISPLLCHKMEGESKLEYLDLSNNFLSGNITNCWMQWKSLAHINLGNNHLTGKIPYSMSLLSNLTSLHLCSNKFFGEVPLSLKNCQNLLSLHLGENKLSGPIPNWIGQGTKVLVLRSNEFSGNIPQHICKLDSLAVLDFANNRLSGQIPNCLHNMTTMVSNSASTDGDHTKDVPRRFFFPTKVLFRGFEMEYLPNTISELRLLDFSMNNLSGSVPLEVFQLTALLALNLSNNQLVGMIPQEIGNMKFLESLDLSRNQFSGRIPQSMVDLGFLEVLNLSFNNFSGQIPLGKQFNSFHNISYSGNPELCGVPLTKNCQQEEKAHNTKQRGEDNDGNKSKGYSRFYLSLGIGFSLFYLNPILCYSGH